MITVAGLEKKYGPIHAVRGIDFEVKGGEIVGLLGHNGAGKTTVLKMLTGYLEPTAGSVSIAGVDVLDDPLAVQSQIGYLPENAPLYPEMLVQEYLVMIAALRGIAPDGVDAAVADAVTATGLQERLLQSIGTLSKGFRQRVGLAQAIVHRPDVLILDEPTSGLDPRQIVEIRGLIRTLAENSTIILSTHILQEVEAVCGRAIILIDGSVAADSPMDELLGNSGIYLSLDESSGSVTGKLEGLDGVAAVHDEGDDDALDGFRRYRIETENGVLPSAAIGLTAKAEGWVIGALQPATTTLERVFNRLMDEHVKREEG